MEAARNVIARHTAKQGHFTDVEEVVRAPVTWEHVQPTRHELITEAVDVEVHQHHYHTTIQPLSQTQFLPTKHSHHVTPPKRVSFEHADSKRATKETQRRITDLAASFKDTLRIAPTTQSSTKMPAVIGTHYHHHVHETVQPIIYKETIPVEVVHTMIPIHEKHYVAAEHHGISKLPVTTMRDFLTIVPPERHAISAHEGTPRAYRTELITTIEQLGLRNPAINTNNQHGSSSARRSAEVKLPQQPEVSKVRRSAEIELSPQADVSAPSTPIANRFNARKYSIGSSSSVSDSSTIESPATPKTPASLPRKPIGQIPNITHGGAERRVEFSEPALSAKTTNFSRPVKIVDTDVNTSPRSSADSAVSNRRSFMNRLAGRA